MKHNKNTLLPKLLALLHSDYVTAPTRNALLARMGKPVMQNIFFDDKEISLLAVVCDLLLDQDAENRILEIEFYIDKRLAENTKDGWRYDVMPPDGEMYKMGLKGINESSMKMFDQSFIELKKNEQLAILSLLQNGKAVGNVWEKLSAKIFFEELLTESAEIFFSHPLVQADMEYVGMADAKGWQQIGLNESENIEKVFD